MPRVAFIASLRRTAIVLAALAISAAATAGWRWLQRNRELALTDKSGVQCRWIYEGILTRAYKSPLFPLPDAFPEHSAAWTKSLLETQDIDESWLLSPLCRDRPVSVSYYYYFRPTVPYGTRDELIVLENPELHDSRKAWAAFSNRGLVMLEGDSLWDVVDGLAASDGTRLRRPPR